MKRVSIELSRHHSDVWYTVSVYDVESPVNYHSYDCVYRKSDCDLKNLIRDVVQRGFYEEVRQLASLLQDFLLMKSFDK